MSSGGVGGDKGFFGIGSNDLDVDVVVAGEEEALADGEIREAFLFFFGQLKDVGKNVDGGRRLFEEKLHRGVGDDGATHF